MITVALTNQKGGVSKTTTAYALATGLHNKGKRVLIVDADPQSNLSFTAGVDIIALKENRTTLYDVFRGDCKPADAVHEIKPGLDILTVGLDAAGADMELAARPAREKMLLSALKGVDYDFCIIDTAPTLGLLTMNALTAADTAIIPLNADIYSLQGMEQLRGYIDNIKQYTNEQLTVSGLLITKYKGRQNLTGALNDTIERAATAFNSKVYKARIRESVAVKETQLLKTDIYEGAPNTTATQDYIAFIDEFLSDYGV